MTVRHRPRKGAKGKSFLYAHGKAFPKPQLFRRKRPKIPRRRRITLHTPPALPASFRPATAPLPALFAAKRGFFAPNARRTRPRRAPERPVLPRRRPAFARPAPEKGPAWPGFARDPGAAHTPDAPEAPACAAFRPDCARFFPPCAAFRPPKPRPPSPPPAPARHVPGAGKPDFLGQLSRFAVEKRVPQGGIKSLKSGGWRPPPTFA